MTGRLDLRPPERRQVPACVRPPYPDRLAESPSGADSSQSLAREPGQRAGRGVDPALVESRIRPGRRSRSPIRVPPATSVPAQPGLARSTFVCSHSKPMLLNLGRSLPAAERSLVRPPEHTVGVQQARCQSRRRDEPTLRLHRRPQNATTDSLTSPSSLVRPIRPTPRPPPGSPARSVCSPSQRQVDHHRPVPQVQLQRPVRRVGVDRKPQLLCSVSMVPNTRFVTTPAAWEPQKIVRPDTVGKKNR